MVSDDYRDSLRSSSGTWVTIGIRGLSKMFVEFVDKNKTTNPITFKFVYN